MRVILEHRSSLPRGYAREYFGHCSERLLIRAAKLLRHGRGEAVPVEVMLEHIRIVLMALLAAAEVANRDGETVFVEPCVEDYRKKAAERLAALSATPIAGGGT
jgi:hypothetical protein